MQAALQPQRPWLWPAAIATLVFISFRPFAVYQQSATGAPTGDITNQLGFAAIGAFCGWLLVKRAPRENLGAAFTLTWLAALPVLALGVLTADSPSSAMRAMIFSIIVIVAAFTIIALPRTKEGLVTMLATITSLTVGACFIAVLFVPEKGVHQAEGFEAFHAGLWRGVYDHKNIASYVMGGLALVALFVARNGRPWLGLALTVLCVVFTLKAGSKTVLGVLPVAYFAAAIAGWVTWRPLRLLTVTLPVFALMAATLGAVLHPPILEALRDVVPDLSYTGRTDLWEFGLQYLRPVLMTGYGFESFWGTLRVAGLEQPIELDWDVRGIVHGHNSWLDLAVGFGLPGALVLSMFIVVLPLRDYLAIPRVGMPKRLATLFISLWVLTALGASLESFFFRRADPVWFLMLIAIMGLRITAHRTRELR